MEMALRPAPFACRSEESLNLAVSRLAQLAFLLLLPLAASAAELPPRPRMNKQNYEQRMRAQIDDLTRKIHSLSTRSSHFRGEQLERFEENLKGLQKRERLARVRLENIKKSGSDQWPKLKSEEDAAVIALKKSYQHVANHYP